MRTLRWICALCGGAAAGYGGWLFAGTGLANVRAALIWLIGGVFVHDALLAPATLVCVVVAMRYLPSSRGPATVSFVVLGTVTIAAIPVLGRFGARADNPTLLDRNYLAGWCVFAALVLIVVVGVAALGRARGRSRTGAR